MKASGRSPPDSNLDPKTSFSGWVTRELCWHQVFNISSLCSSSFFFCIMDTLYVNFTGMRPWRNQEQSPVLVWKENYINVPLTHSRVVRCDNEAQQGRGFSYLSYSKLAAISQSRIITQQAIDFFFNFPQQYSLSSNWIAMLAKHFQKHHCHLF